MTRARRLLYTVVVLTVVAVAVEAAATWAEPRWFPYERSQPLPAPTSTHDARVTQAKNATLRRSLASGAIPLASDPERGWALSPDTVTPIAGWSIRTNSLGLRGPEPRENALRRILVLGAFRMMRTLNEAARIRAEVEATGTVPDSASWAK